MDRYINDTYGGSRQENSLGAEQVQHVRPGQSQAHQPQQINKLPSNSIQRMAAAQQALAAQRASRINRSGPGQRVQRAQMRTSVLRQWDGKCAIQNVSLPQSVSSPTCSKRFRITLTWIDGSGRPHKQDINFGQEGKQQFIDHKDPALRDARLAKMQEQTLMNPLHPNFWKFHLLNKYPDINTAYMKFVQDNGLINRRLVLKKQFRQNYVPQSTNASTGLKRSAAQRLSTNIASMLPQTNSNNDLNIDELDDYRYSQF